MHGIAWLLSEPGATAAPGPPQLILSPRMEEAYLRGGDVAGALDDALEVLD